MHGRMHRSGEWVEFPRRDIHMEWEKVGVCKMGREKKEKVITGTSL